MMYDAPKYLLLLLVRGGSRKMKARKISLADLEWGELDSPTGKAEFAGMIGIDKGVSMSCSMTRFHNSPYPWTVNYDELLVCVSGTAHVTIGQQTFVVDAGDVMWIPKGTELIYDGDLATVFTTVYTGKES
jgi:ethanolamine utilization protein EutQ